MKSRPIAQFILLWGKGRCGKTTVASQLVETINRDLSRSPYTARSYQLSFSYPLKQALRLFWPQIDWNTLTSKDKEQYRPFMTSIADAVKAIYPHYFARSLVTNTERILSHNNQNYSQTIFVIDDLRFIEELYILEGTGYPLTVVNIGNSLTNQTTSNSSQKSSDKHNSEQHFGLANITNIWWINNLTKNEGSKLLEHLVSNNAICLD